jgi:hypothetical protein
MKFFILQFLLTFLILQDQSVAYKPKDEFLLEVKLEFKHRPVETNALIKNTTPASSLLPYLTLQLTLLSCSEHEVSLRVEDDRRSKLVSKKASVNATTTLDIGFTDDIKGGIISQQYVAYLLNKQKDRVSKIVIAFDKLGNYYVNGDLRGKI